MTSEYEETRARNIAKNKAILQSMGLDKPMFEPKEKPRKQASPKKRKATQDDTEGPVAKVQRVQEEKTADNERSTPGIRRSSRNAGKQVDYTSELKVDVPQPIARKRTSGNDGPMGREAGQRLHNPKTYGHIPNITVGTWWLTREACSRDAIHAPWVGGISGSDQGAYSVALSGGYDDDVDLGYAFTYTGSGGRDLRGTKTAPKNLRTAPQSSDQSFENQFNKILKRSSETKKPVRVIRGFKLKSRYAPSEGYRYDGLYTVEKAWMEKGLNSKGYLVCKYAFKRLSNQPPLPIREDYPEGVAEKSTSDDA